MWKILEDDAKERRESTIYLTAPCFSKIYNARCLSFWEELRIRSSAHSSRPLMLIPALYMSHSLRMSPRRHPSSGVTGSYSDNCENWSITGRVVHMGVCQHVLMKCFPVGMPYDYVVVTMLLFVLEVGISSTLHVA